MARVFIDGEAGTTGLEIRERLAGRTDIEPVELPVAERKDPRARAAALAAADVAILCLPDAAALEAVALAEGCDTILIDASTAHRTAPGWVYGFPEMTAGQADRIAGSRRISNPGCYPTGAIGLIRPLVEAGLLPAEAALTVNAISGYTGGGKSLISRYEAEGGPAFYLYGLGLSHKHLPEMHLHSGLARPPLFVPSVGGFRRGMLVSLPLNTWSLPGRPGPEAIQAALEAHYAGQSLVSVLPPVVTGETAPELDAEAMAGSDGMQLRLFANPATEQVLLTACLDNLGKGASGAAVQNLNLVLGQAAETSLRPVPLAA